MDFSDEVPSTIAEVQTQLCEAKLRLHQMGLIVSLCQQRELIGEFQEELRTFLKLKSDTVLLNNGDA